MNKRIVLAVATVLALGAWGCPGRGQQATRTETIEPALPPVASDDDEAVVTQTTEIGEERSPNEGGVLTRPTGVDTNPPYTTTSGSPVPPNRPPAPARKAPPGS